MRYNLGGYPVWLWFFGGKLCFAGTTFHNFGTSQEDFLHHMFNVAEAPERHFLPEGWHFPKY